MKRLLIASSIGLLAGFATAQAFAADGVTGGPAVSSASAGVIDYAHAKPMPLPQASAAPPTSSAGLSAASFGSSGASSGAIGTGKASPVVLAPAASNLGGGASPAEFGTSGQPYTTSRSSAYAVNTVIYYPLRAAGKLFFKINGSSFVCSASLIKKGVVVTAAHCVSNFGQRQFYSGWQFVPAYTNGVAPYGVWTARGRIVMTSYFDGSDSCAQSGVICQNDVAVLILNTQNGQYPGTQTGYFGYGYNGYSFNSHHEALITQLGYPVALDRGLLQERTNSQGFTDGSLSNNTIIGSLQTGGSSGGPWLVNFGMAPALSGFSFGTMASHNIVVGTTSWGYTNGSVKQQGASPFTSNNIVPLVQAACNFAPSAC